MDIFNPTLAMYNYVYNKYFHILKSAGMNCTLKAIPYSLLRMAHKTTKNNFHVVDKEAMVLLGTNLLPPSTILEVNNLKLSLEKLLI